MIGSQCVLFAEGTPVSMLKAVALGLAWAEHAAHTPTNL